MASLLDYITWRGDVPMMVSPLNEVDNYIICKIGSLDFTGIVPEDGGYVPLHYAIKRYFDEGRSENLGPLMSREFIPMLKMLPDTLRYGTLELSGYRQHLSEERTEQFSALTVRLADGRHYVSYRGTDDTIVGWKEDFLLAVEDHVPAQSDALDYLNWCAKTYEGKLLIGGHSKGGNLSIYAAACVSEDIQERIERVYNYDGPGFQDDFLKSEGYLRILDKIVTILSQNAMVGTLMKQSDGYNVVKSSRSGVMAHDGLTWQTMPTGFVHMDTLSPSSRAFDEAMDNVLDNMDIEQRRKFIEELFGTLTSGGAETLSDLTELSLRRSLGMAMELYHQPSIQKLARELLTELERSSVKRE